MVRTAIIVVTYNSERFLDDLFESLAAHTDWSTTRLLIVDNASADGTRGRLERAAATAPYIELLPQTTNLGFTGGNNIGLARARSLGARYALLLNPDTVVTDGWLSALEHVLDDRPKVGAAQPLLMLHDEPDRVNTAGNAIHFCGFGFCDNFRKHVDELGLDGSPALGALRDRRGAAAALVRARPRRRFRRCCSSITRTATCRSACARPATTASSCRRRASSTSTTRRSRGAKYRWLERNRWMVMIKDWPDRCAHRRVAGAGWGAGGGDVVRAARRLVQ